MKSESPSFPEWLKDNIKQVDLDRSDKNDLIPDGLTNTQRWVQTDGERDPPKPFLAQSRSRGKQMNQPRSDDLVLGSSSSPISADAAALGGITKEIEKLNLRWSDGKPKPGDRLVKGYLIGYRRSRWSLDVDYLLDSDGILWSIKGQVNLWMQPIGLNMTGGSFPYEILGVTERVTAVIADGKVAEYYKCNALCYAVVQNHEQATYLSVFNTEHKHNSKGFVESIALLVDESELRHRWKVQVREWNNNHSMHPVLPLDEIPPVLSPDRVEWLKTIKKGDRVSIVSPYYAKNCEDDWLLDRQPGIVERVGKKIIRVAYIESHKFSFWRMGYKQGQTIKVSVAIGNGVKQSGPRMIHSWIDTPPQPTINT